MSKHTGTPSSPLGSAKLFPLMTAMCGCVMMTGAPYLSQGQIGPRSTQLCWRSAGSVSLSNFSDNCCLQQADLQYRAVALQGKDRD